MPPTSSPSIMSETMSLADRAARMAETLLKNCDTPEGRLQMANQFEAAIPGISTVLRGEMSRIGLDDVVLKMAPLASVDSTAVEAA